MTPIDVGAEMERKTAGIIALSWTGRGILAGSIGSDERGAKPIRIPHFGVGTIPPISFIEWVMGWPGSWDYRGTNMLRQEDRPRPRGN